MNKQSLSKAPIIEAITPFQDPETGRSIVQLGQVHDLQCNGDSISMVLGLTTWSAPLWEEIRTELVTLLEKTFSGRKAEVKLAVEQRPAEAIGQTGLKAKSVIAVGAGKGGVGKSSLAAYLALGLARAGCQVGLMDADIYGPSIPHLLGTEQRAVIRDNRIQPVLAESLKVISIGYIAPKGEPIIWRGPMLHTALAQFLRDTEWGELDYLIIDLPPGTGDIALSLSQLLPLTGAVVVGTPQELALLDVVKAIEMFRRVNIEVLGMIENMSLFVCSKCGAEHDIFGSGGAEKKAAQMNVPFLGRLPLATELRTMADQGQIAKAFDSPTLRPYLDSIILNLIRHLVRERRKQPVLPTLTVL